ncbi:MAG: PIG-L family deacetylase [Calditrichaceae bacterium]|nr:PIG-L family deacetylase [Calditrichaceae bacterium]
MNRSIYLLISCLVLLKIMQAQPIRPADAAEIELGLNKLNVLGSVLYIAAHPDDENTAVMAYMSKGKLVRTGYLSMTRGDGGQNLLGQEKNDLLGVLRTQELLAARRIDGAEQFFTRAIDFGYSKTPEETMRFWNKEKILSDLVWVIRNFKPDVILTRFSKEQGGHGHHLASAILAEEAFRAAANPNQFPEQLKYVEPWQAKRILWNSWRPELENRSKALPPIIQIDLGDYNPLLGKSYMEIAAISRTMHKTQGFGSSAQRGNFINYFEHTAGDPAETSLFDGIDLTWNRIENSEKIQQLIQKAIDEFNPQNPSKSVSALIAVYREINKHAPGFWIDKKKADVVKLIQQCSGLWLEAIADQHTLIPGDSLGITITAINRSDLPIALEKLKIISSNNAVNLSRKLEYNQPFEFKTKIQIPESAQISQPFWLREPSEYGRFNVSDQKLIGKAENDPEFLAQITMGIMNQVLVYQIPVRHRWNDATKGEMYRPVVIQPALSVWIDQSVYIFANQESKPIKIHLENYKAPVSGKLKLQLPDNWSCQPESFEIDLKANSPAKIYTFTINPPKNENSATVYASVSTGKRELNQSIYRIEYDHIPIQTVFEQAQAEIVRVNLAKQGDRIGYIMGPGDEIPPALEQVGYQVDLLSDDDIESQNLSKYDAIICGVRAFNTRETLQSLQIRLNDYVKNGGTWIVQHNTRFGYRSDQIGPYSFEIGRDRIADETVKMEFINPDHALLNNPNKISQEDFDGWVQERGLYFAEKWDKAFQPILKGNDTGENETQGALLYAKYGKGVFIYSGLSFFRQLPAGAPGAYRLFVNMISAGKQK